MYAQYEAKDETDEKRYLANRAQKKPSAVLDYESSSTYYEKIMMSPKSVRNDSAQAIKPKRSGREDSKLSTVMEDVSLGGIRLHSNNRVIQTSAYNKSVGNSNNN